MEKGPKPWTEIGVGERGVNQARAGGDHPGRGRRGIDQPHVGFDRETRDRPQRPSRPVKSVSGVINTKLEGVKRTSCGMESEKPDVPDQQTADSSTKKADLSVSTGIKPSGATTSHLVTSTNAPGAGSRPMALKDAVSLRRAVPATPLDAEQWESALRSSCLYVKYPRIPMSIRRGADAGFPPITRSFTPLNNSSTEELSDAFDDIIQSEYVKGRYLGPFTQKELELELGPFQSSPLSLVPKAGKPGKYRLIQNLSHPHSNRPVASINSHLNSDDFPCTWGTFHTVCTLVRSLPPRAQAAVRDIAEAYRIVPLHPDQWAGVVVRVSNEPGLFALNTCNSFGCATAGGVFGMFGDALADILRAKGIGPILKWVDDFIFFRIPCLTLAEYNEQRNRDHEAVEKNGGMLQTGGRLWYQGKTRGDGGADQFAEDLSLPLKRVRDRLSDGIAYPYGVEEIDAITQPLGVPWETTKDVPFQTVVPFVGFSWDLERKRVSLPEQKKEKYVLAILEWRQHVTHVLDDARKLYGKLLYACYIVPQGRAYLTNLEKMMGTFRDRPFAPRHSPRRLDDDLTWWLQTLSRPYLERIIPGGRVVTDVQGYSDASSSVGIGVVIGKRWRSWRLLSGWQTGGRDIGWAEAVGMEFLVRTVLHLNVLPAFQVYGDNIGVVEGWWTGRSRSTETNEVFKRIHEILGDRDTTLVTRYVNTKWNPADGPSRGIYPPAHLLLPRISIPAQVRAFVVDFDEPCASREGHFSGGIHPTTKSSFSATERQRRAHANADGFKHAEDPFQSPSARWDLGEATTGQRN